MASYVLTCCCRSNTCPRRSTGWLTAGRAEGRVAGRFRLTRVCVRVRLRKCVSVGVGVYTGDSVWFHSARLDRREESSGVLLEVPRTIETRRTPPYGSDCGFEHGGGRLWLWSPPGWSVCVIHEIGLRCIFCVCRRTVHVVSCPAVGVSGCRSVQIRRLRRGLWLFLAKHGAEEEFGVFLSPVDDDNTTQIYHSNG